MDEALAPKKEIYVFIPVVDIEKIKQEMLDKAESKIKKLRGE